MNRKRGIDFVKVIFVELYKIELCKAFGLLICGPELAWFES